MHRYEAWIASKKAWKPSSLAHTLSKGNSHPSSRISTAASISEGEATQQPRFPVMDGFICQARKQNLLFFLLLTACNRVRCTQPKASLATTKQVMEPQQKHTVRLSLMLSAADKHIISSTMQGKVKEPRPPLIYTSTTVWITMENRKKIQSTDEFHTDNTDLKKIFK